MQVVHLLLGWPVLYPQPSHTQTMQIRRFGVGSWWCFPHHRLLLCQEIVSMRHKLFEICWLLILISPRSTSQPRRFGSLSSLTPPTAWNQEHIDWTSYLNMRTARHICDHNHSIFALFNFKTYVAYYTHGISQVAPTYVSSRRKYARPVGLQTSTLFCTYIRHRIMIPVSEVI